MKTPSKLQSKADEFELPVKPNIWENIEKQLPKEKKRRSFLFWWFSCILLLAIVGVAIYRNTRAENKVKTIAVISEKKKPAEIINQSPVGDNVGNSAQPVGKSSDKTSESVSKITKVSAQLPNFKPDNSKNTGGQIIFSPKENKGAITYSKEDKGNSDDKADKSNKDNWVDKADKARDSVAGISDNSLKTKKHIAEVKADSQVKLIAKEQNEPQDSQSKAPQIKTSISPPAPAKGGFFVLAGMGAFDAQLKLKPSLMKIPAGFGKQLILGIGRHFKNYSIGLGLEYNSITQSTTMPGTYNPNYVKVLDPSAASAVPEVYRSKLSDTNLLLVPGSSHNKINQSFRLLSFGLDFSYRLLSLKKLSVGFAANPKYTRMLGAETFFWDNLNSIGVPFYAKDQKVVRVNQFSAAIRLNLDYKLTPRSSLWVAPYYEQYFSPFLKHYYQVSFRNLGASTGLKWEF